MNRYTIIFILLLSFATNATAEHEPFIYRIFPFLKYEINKSYIAEGPSNFSLKPYVKTEQGLTSFQYADTTTGDNFSFGINDKASLLTGLEVAYKGFSFGYDFKPSEVFGHKKRSGYDFNCSVFGQAAGCDFFFSTKDRARVRNNKNKLLIEDEADCFSSSRMQASLYYVIKKDIFSMPAVFNESFVQKRTAGSIIIDANITNTLITLNHSRVPAALDSLLTQNVMFSHMRQSMLCVGCGYGRNTVYKHVMLHWSAQPSLPLYMSKKIVNMDGAEYATNLWDFNINAKLRGAVQWHYGNHSLNLNLVVDINLINQGAFSAVDSFMRGYLSYRILFGKKTTRY